MGARPAAKAPRSTVLDSDVLISYLRGAEGARRLLESIPHSMRVLSAVVIMELVQGCTDRTELKRLRRFFDSAFPHPVHISSEISRRATVLVERHAPAQRMTPTDAVIAAALSTKAALATGNIRDFEFVKGLTLLPFRR